MPDDPLTLARRLVEHLRNGQHEADITASNAEEIVDVLDELGDALPYGHKAWLDVGRPLDIVDMNASTTARKWTEALAAAEALLRELEGK